MASLASPLFCSRPRSSEIDFASAEFIVAKSSGLDISTGHLTIGDRVPEGELSAEALRQLYEPPTRLIELLNFAILDPELKRCCIERGSYSESIKITLRGFDLNSLGILSKKELARLCRDLKLDENGSKQQLRDRIAAMVVN